MKTKKMVRRRVRHRQNASSGGKCQCAVARHVQCRAAKRGATTSNSHEVRM